MKKKDNKYAIDCNPSYGPIVGNGGDIGIDDNCNRDDGGCTNFGTSRSSYECRSPRKCSLFVGTAGPDQRSYFKVSDYEVFTYY